jgi:hypothetical protein
MSGGEYFTLLYYFLSVSPSHEVLPWFRSLTAWVVCPLVMTRRSGKYRPCVVVEKMRPLLSIDQGVYLPGHLPTPPQTGRPLRSGSTYGPAKLWVNEARDRSVGSREIQSDSRVLQRVGGMRNGPET